MSNQIGLETTMNMKNSDFDEDELIVADILLQIPRIIFESKHCFSVNWGYRRTRSAIDRSLSSAPKCENVSSPTTPLSFSPTESDWKRKRPKVSYGKENEDRLKMVDRLTHERQLLKSEIENVTGSHNGLTAVNSGTKPRKQRKEKNWSKTVEDLTHQKELLKTEIENVKRLRNSMKALNSELKTKKQQCNHLKAIAEDKEESGEEVHIQQPLQLFPCHPDGSRTRASAASTPGSDSDVAKPVGPHVISDLNVSPKQNLGPNPCPPLDLSLNISLNFDPAQSETKSANAAAAAAEARKKRLLIYKLKKTKAVQNSNPSILSFG